MPKTATTRTERNRRTCYRIGPNLAAFLTNEQPDPEAEQYGEDTRPRATLELFAVDTNTQTAAATIQGDTEAVREILHTLEDAQHLAKRIEGLNAFPPEAPQIGAGMFAGLQYEARKVAAITIKTPEPAPLAPEAC